MTPLWREQAVHAIDVALAEAIYSLAVLPALIQRQTDVPASPTKLLGGADQFNRRWAEQYTAAATSLFGDSDQFSGFLCLRNESGGGNPCPPVLERCRTAGWQICGRR